MSEWKPSDFRKANPDLFSGAGSSNHALVALSALVAPRRQGKSEWVKKILEAYAPDFADYEPGRSYFLTWNPDTMKMEVTPVEPYTPKQPASES